MIKFCIAGNNNIAVDLLYFSFKYFDKSDICVLLNNNDINRNTWQKSLGFFANIEKVTILDLEDVQKIQNIIFFSAQYDKIIKPDRFVTTELFNLHFSYLPEYKGMYPSIMPILECKKYSGVTLHKIDRGIDTGDIIAQKKYLIKNLTAEQLYKKNLKEGFNLIAENFEIIINKKYKTTKQPVLNSTYVSKARIDFSDLEINMSQTAFQISRYIDAFNFRVYQLARFQGDKINKSKILKTKSTLKPGTVLSRNYESITISTIDYDIKLYIDFCDDLLECCKNNDIEKTRKIISYIDHPDFITKEGWTPLMIAAYHGSYEVFKLLIENNADFNATNFNNTTVLMFSKDGYVKTKDIRIFDLLVKIGANKYFKDIYGKTIFDYCEIIDILAYKDNNYCNKQ